MTDLSVHDGPILVFTMLRSSRSRWAEIRSRPLDVQRSRVARGDIVVIPTGSAFLFSLPPDVFELIGELRVPGSSLAATMNTSVGAGFYADAWGPLPYTLGRAPGELYLLFGATEPWEFRRHP